MEIRPTLFASEEKYCRLNLSVLKSSMTFLTSRKEQKCWETFPYRLNPPEELSKLVGVVISKDKKKNEFWGLKLKTVCCYILDA